MPPIVPPFNGSGPVVQTKNGPVQGIFRGNPASTVAWWGIPFAEPPVGSLRLRAPKALEKTWTQPLDASKVPPSCKEVEDCLYLNVYAPTMENYSSLLPVMVFIYGGGFVHGNNFEFGLYDGHNFCEEHAVVLVAMNYRLGNLGFMALDALREEDPHSSTGNYGVQDQSLALQWVQRNIRQFGGDPQRVTLFGESAGGMSVMWHLVSPKSAGLFHAAIMESGTSTISFFFQPYKEASAYHEDTAKILNCSSTQGSAAQLRCLRQLPMDAILHGAGSRHLGNPQPEHPSPEHHSPMYPLMPAGPVIDGTEVGLLDVPIRLVEAGRFNKVPLILGANANGGTIFEPHIHKCVPHARWPATLFPKTVQLTFDYLFGSYAPKVSAVYNTTEYKAAELPADSMISRMIRDAIFMCPLRSLATAWIRHSTPAFVYVFDFDYGLLIDNVLHLGDFHAGELPFVFRNWLWAVRSVDLRSNPKIMADIMSCRWAAFAYTHDPNGGINQSSWPKVCLDMLRDDSHWPLYTFTDRPLYVLQDKPEVRRIAASNYYPDDLFPRDSKCDLWEEVSALLPWASKQLALAAEQPRFDAIVV